MSYSLFGDHGRYWNMVYPILVINASICKGWISRFHISNNETNHPFYAFLRQLSENSPYVQIDIHREPYNSLEGTFWRLKPIWDAKTTYVFCKDLDAMPTSLELKAMWVFMRKGNIIHGIRSHPFHTINLMAGLCGFNCLAIRGQQIMNGGYENYINKFRRNVGKFDWGCDQRALADFFHGGEAKYLQGHTIDTPLRNAPKHIVGYYPIHLPDHEYTNSNISDCDVFREVDLELLSWIDSKIAFEGQAYAVTHEDFEMLESRNGTDFLKLIQDYRKRYL
jgi:hypothetical protein